MKQLFLFLAAVLLFPRLSAADTGVVEFDSSPEGRKRYLAQPYYSWGRGKFPVKPGQRGRIVSLTNTRTKYVFFLFGNEESNGAWHPVMGMHRPSKANWGSAGFFDFSFGRKSMKNCAVALENASGGAFTLKFTAPGYEARCRFEIRENDDRLYMLFTAPVVTSVKLTCYPSSFAGGYSAGKQLRKRYAVTPERRIPAEKKVNLSAKEFKVFLGDTYFDPALNRGEGPCGVIFDPGRMTGTLSVQNYGCTFTFTGKGEMPVVLFDFHGVSNAEGERTMRELPVKFHR